MTHKRARDAARAIHSRLSQLSRMSESAALDTIAQMIYGDYRKDRPSKKFMRLYRRKQRSILAIMLQEKPGEF